VTEPSGGSDIAHVETTIRRDGDSYLLNGSKMFITNGVNADLVVVLARSKPEAGHHGLTMVVVERGAPGYTVGRKLDKLGWRASDTAELVFQDCRVPVANRLGEENNGFYLAVGNFQWERLWIAISAVSSAQRSLELAIEYAANRVQFGKRLADMQVIRHQIADMSLMVEQARQLTYHALWLHSQKVRCTREVSMAKIAATEADVQVADRALQIHGGYGYMMEYPIQRAWRRDERDHARDHRPRAGPVNRNIPVPSAAAARSGVTGFYLGGRGYTLKVPFEFSLPFAAVVGQEQMKQALLLNAIDPAIGGVLLRGDRGTAKSSAVRALARLLPDYEAVDGCPFRCDPALPSRYCEHCRRRAKEGPLPVTRLPMRIIELPINASEDRLVGSIDIEAAVRSGSRRFQPGVLAEANRNLLYVDEVNLLDDHLVDVLLDAAAMGVNVVEREGMSVVHPAHFILVGTMNPEEGELRPQLLDRFGLCVEIETSSDIDERLQIIETERRLEEDPAELQMSYAGDEAALRGRLQAARARLESVVVSNAIRTLIARLCLDGSVAGHRADLVVARAARAICALRGHPAVELGDVLQALELALAHRRRDLGGDRKAEIQQLASKAAEQLAQIQSVVTPAENGQPVEGQVGQQDGSSGGDASEAWTRSESTETTASELDGDDDSVIQLRTFNVKKLDLPRERQSRRAAGKRTSTKSKTKRGRYVRSSQAEKVTDVAFDATMRAAAPHQLSRRQAAPESGNQLQLETHDLRQKVRERKTGNLIVFVVDASASMDAEQRMLATKGAILSLLRHAYVRRDKVSLVAFSGRNARVVLRPTSSVDLAERRLERLTIGGTTPLTHGLITALKLIKTERLRDPQVYPLLVLISDGRGNISLFGEEPLMEAQRAAGQIKQEGIRAMVIDSTRDFSNQPGYPRNRVTSLYGAYAFNVCHDLAERLGGRYYGLFDLSQSAIVDTVQREMLRTGSV
jgi:magnesium chelatase subunit D